MRPLSAPHSRRFFRTILLGIIICAPSFSQVTFKEIPNGFDGIKWGGLEEDVRLKKPKLFPVFNEPVGEKKNIVTRFFPDPTNAQFFFFVDGHLMAVVQHPNEQSEYLRIANDIKSRYGEPNKKSERSFTFKGNNLTANLALWNGNETDIQLSLISSTSEKVLASIAYLQPNARASTNFSLANPIVLETGLGIHLPEFGKAYEDLDWGIDFQTVASRYPGSKLQSADSAGSTVIYEGFGSPLPFSRRFVFSNNKLVGVILQLTNQQVKYIYGGRVALLEKLSIDYGRPRKEPSLTHPIVEGRDWFSERFDLIGNDNTEVYVDFRRPIQLPDLGDNAFVIAKIVFYSKGVIQGI